MCIFKEVVKDRIKDTKGRLIKPNLMMSIAVHHAVMRLSVCACPVKTRYMNKTKEVSIYALWIIVTREPL